MMSDCKLHQIASPPPTKQLNLILAELIEADANSNDHEAVENQRNAMMATAARMRKGMSPDAAWCISLIYTLKPSHPIFAKDYLILPKRRPRHRRLALWTTQVASLTTSLSQIAARKAGLLLVIGASPRWSGSSSVLLNFSSD